MPIRDYMCPSCKGVLPDQFEQGFELQIHFCSDCEVQLQVLPASISIKPSSETTKYREMKTRFEKRNKRIQAMPEQKQKQMAKIIDTYKGKAEFGGKRYLT
jgi:hypothetical protein